ncbi:MAG: response regulator [Bacteroidaceae bacterium]|nr:response regulator [Bacteroidaceae bacterium]
MELDYSKYTILIVDDVPLNIILVKKMITPRIAVNIRTANNGVKALESIREQRPDLVLLDLMMPVMDGFGVLEAVKKDSSLKDLHIVILSALNSELDIMRGLKAGANDFITKPIIAERLFSCIEKQLTDVELKK